MWMLECAGTGATRAAQMRNWCDPMPVTCHFCLWPNPPTCFKMAGVGGRGEMRMLFARKVILFSELLFLGMSTRSERRRLSAGESR